MDKKVIYKRDLDGVNWQEMKATLTADNFDNGRTAEQLQRSFANSHTTSIATIDGRIVGTARALSDGVCNAYIVDVWTYTPFRHQGIARQMVEDLFSDLPGQHVYLFTDDIPEFYRKLGFIERGIGMEYLVGSWLQN
jgi:ribosomal protein S18 acetylase RimI-like enzyme